MVRLKFSVLIFNIAVFSTLLLSLPLQLLSKNNTYAVGIKTEFIHDTSRPLDLYGEPYWESQGQSDLAFVFKNPYNLDSYPWYSTRTLVSDIYFPVNSSDITNNSQQLTMGDIFFNEFDLYFTALKLSPFFISKQTVDFLMPIALVKDSVTQQKVDDAITQLYFETKNEYLNVPISNDGKFPLIINTHGNGGTRSGEKSFDENLTKNGYIVIAIEHPGNAGVSQVGKDPEVGLYNPILDPLNGIWPQNGAYPQTTPLGISASDLLVLTENGLKERINDIKAVIAWAKKQNDDPASYLYQKIDLEHIGLMGFSYGGLTSLVGTELIPQIKAGIARNPSAVPDVRNAINPDLLGKPNSILLTSLSEPYPFAKPTKPIWYETAGQDQFVTLITSAYVELGAKSPTFGNISPSITDYFNNALGPVVYTTLANIDHLQVEDLGRFYFPDLVVNTFPKVFEPTEEYTFQTNETIREISFTKHLAFFDYFLKGKQGALGPLQSQEYKNNGLNLKIRNLP